MKLLLPLILITIGVLTTTSFLSCGQWSVPTEITGNWQSAPAPVTVRTEPKWMHFEFTTDTAEVSITINADKTVSGKIGNATFTNGTIRKNPGNPDRTGIAYIIACGHITGIFENDPAPSKEVEIWLSPATQTMQAELRLTEKHGVFPMAGFTFEKR